jgi:nucleotide-binding universal stress UspA family protein
MKILTCTDGSESSRKALKQASIIAGGCNVDEVVIIHVLDPSLDTTFPYYETISAEQMENFRKMVEGKKEKAKMFLSEAEKIFKEKEISTRTILKEGNPPDTIVKLAQEEGFDMIVVGSRGIGGLKKLLLGSVSNAIIQEVQNCSVLVVK